jgi:dipeptidyl aminopeptidase B
MNALHGFEKDVVHQPQKGSLAAWKYISLVSIILIYGTSLLISQVNSLYVNHIQYKHQQLTYIHNDEELPQLKLDSGTLSTSAKIPLTFQAVRNGTFNAVSKEIQWIQTSTSLTDDSGDYVVIEDGKYYLKSLRNENSSTVLYDSGTEVEYKSKTYDVESVKFSNDLKIALLTCNKVHNWRHSYFATYFLFNTETKETKPLYIENIAENENIALAIISPDSKKVSFVLNNNVYITDISDFTNPVTKQITSDGGPQLFNGKPDWVYEEEVFEGDSALWWSPDSNHLLILRSNDTEVPTYPIPYFVKEDANHRSSYPLVEEIKYPKAGFPNPVVDIVVYDFANETMKQLDGNDPFYNDADIDNLNRLITEVIWVGNEQVLLRVTNRESDVLKIFIVSCPSSSQEITSLVARFEDGRNDKSWFEITHNTIYIPKSETREQDGYIDMINVDGYDHIAYFSPPEASEPKALLTSGDWEVVGGAAAFDFITEKVYYVSTEKSSIERHVYSVNIDGTDRQNVTDISVDAWFDASFSIGSRYLLLSYTGPDVPYQQLLDLHEHATTEFTSNENLEDILTAYDLPETIFGNVTLEENLIVNYKESLPLNFNPEKKYPLLFFVYGGPGSQLVTKQFAVSFSSIIAAELDAVVVTVDGRGTGFKGKTFRNVVRDNLGTHEVLDQVAAAKHWVSKGYIDSERTAIWGWSYGGYMTLKTLEHDQGEVFKYGMSVAPVTSWNLYDSVYTERYMHTPQQNPDGYNQSRVHDFEGFKNVTRFLLMHGTGDDNVHFQNSLQLVDSFDLAGIENYDMFVFPDSDHSIRWHNAGIIVYDRLFTWLKRAFDGEFENLHNFRSMSDLNNEDEDIFINLYG